MRLIQQIGQMLAKAVALRQEGRTAEALAEIDLLCLQTVGLPLERIRRLSPESLAQTLAMGGALRHHRAIMLAELLLQDAEVSVAADRGKDALLSRLHAFCLLADAVPFLPVAERGDYRLKADALATQLRSFAAHPYLGEKIRSYEASGAASP